MDPEEIHRFIAPLSAGYDYVKGSRFLPGGGTLNMPWLRRLGNKIFTGLVNLLYGVNYTDLGYGSNALWKNGSEQVKLDSDGFQIETAMRSQASEAKRKVMEVPNFGHTRPSRTGSLLTFGDGSKILEPGLKKRVHG